MSCTVSAACISAGGLLKVKRIRAKTGSVHLDLAAVAAGPVSTDIVAVDKPSRTTKVLDARGHQAARSSEARKQETQKRVMKQQKQQRLKIVAPLLQELKKRDATIADRDATIASLREELAKVSAERAAESAASASVASSNWKDGIACGRGRYGSPPPTPRTPGRAAQVLPG